MNRREVIVGPVAALVASSAAVVASSAAVASAKLAELKTENDNLKNKYWEAQWQISEYEEILQSLPYDVTLPDSK